MSESEMFAVEVEPGVENVVRVDGPADGEPVMLLHGFMGSGLQWDDNVAPLVDAGYRVVRPDFRGHGGSAKLGDESAYTFEHLRRDTVAVCDGLGLDRPHLVGHSMGGLIAQLMSIQNADRLASVVFVDASPLPGRPERARDRHLRSLIGYRIGAARFIGWLTPVLRRVNVSSAPDRSASERAEALDDLRRSVEDVDPEAFVAFWRQLMDHADLRQALTSVDLPATVIVGEFEVEKLQRGAEALRDNVAGAVLVEIPGAGHSPPMEQPERFNTALLDHLTRVITS